MLDNLQNMAGPEIPVKVTSNEVLIYCMHYLESSGLENLKKIMANFYEYDEISEAKDELKGCCEEWPSSFNEIFRRRVTSKARSGLEKLVEDVMVMTRHLEFENLLPAPAIKLNRLPPLMPEELEMCTILKRIKVVENKLLQLDKVVTNVVSSTDTLEDDLVKISNSVLSVGNMCEKHEEVINEISNKAMPVHGYCDATKSTPLTPVHPHILGGEADFEGFRNTTATAELRTEPDFQNSQSSSLCASSSPGSCGSEVRVVSGGSGQEAGTLSPTTPPPNTNPSHCSSNTLESTTTANTASATSQQLMVPMRDEGIANNGNNSLLIPESPPYRPSSPSVTANPNTGGIYPTIPSPTTSPPPSPPHSPLPPSTNHLTEGLHPSTPTSTLPPSYSQILSSPPPNTNSMNNDPCNPPSMSENGFIEVISRGQRRRNRTNNVNTGVSGTGKSNVVDSGLVPHRSMKHIFLYNLYRCDRYRLREYMVNLGVPVIDIKVLSKHESSKISCKITVNRVDEEKVLSASFWPEGVCFKPWENRSTQNHNNNGATSV